MAKPSPTMQMDFFGHQDQARKQTGRLVALFILAVIGIVVLAYLVVSIGLGFATKGSDGQFNAQALLDWRVLLGVGGVTLLLVGGGTAYKVAQLNGGGRVVAEMLGGRIIEPMTQDPNERKVLNVVEEMAIASGVPVPPVYLMHDENGINAFAAGYSPSDAVIGVTRGCVNHLTRDQFQGVVAHEFSHILNGDMRLNIRLIGVLHGILIIGITGYYLMRMAFYSGGRRRRSSNNKDNSGLALLAVGLGLMAVGFIGVFFGNLIKAGVSRQREFLADASAVQFTRNPTGLAGALASIGGYSSGSSVTNPNAPEASHMFFGQAITSGLNSMFATHPPLPERIKRIDPGWEGSYPDTDSITPAMAAGASGAMGFAGASEGAPGVTSGLTAGEPSGGPSVSQVLPEAPAEGATAIDQIGQPTQAHIAYAAQLLHSMPDKVKDVAHEPYGARAIIYCMLLNEEEEPRKSQLEQLRSHSDAGVYNETLKLIPQMQQLKREAYLPLFDVVIMTLKNLSMPQYKVFKTNVMVLIKADKKVDLFEWSLLRILLHHLEPVFRGAKPAKTVYHSLDQVTTHFQVVLSTLAFVGADNKEEAVHAMAEATKDTGVPQVELMPAKEAGLNRFGQSLDELQRLDFGAKKSLLQACARCICADQEVTVEEAELMRAIADTLDCPMPPLLAGQPLV